MVSVILVDDITVGIGTFLRSFEETKSTELLIKTVELIELESPEDIMGYLGTCK